MYDAGLFHDSRIESIGKEAGRNGDGLRDPYTRFGNSVSPTRTQALRCRLHRPAFPVTVAVRDAW